MTATAALVLEHPATIPAPAPRLSLVPAPAAPSSDADLFALAAAGDAKAFAEIVRRHRPAIVGFCKRRVHCPDDAEDRAQEAFAKAYSMLRAGTLRTDSTAQPLRYLYLIARSRCSATRGYEDRRGAGMHDDLESPEARGLSDAAPNAEDLAAAKGVYIALCESIDALPAAERAALMPRYADDATGKEIGAALGYGRANAQRWLTAAHDRLRRSLAARGYRRAGRAPGGFEVPR